MARAGFSTDRRRAKPFHTRREARMALEDLRRQFPRQAIEAQAMVVTDRAAHITHTRLGQRMVGFAAVLALTGGLAGCSQQPLSGSDYLLTLGRLEAANRPAQDSSAWTHFWTQIGPRCAPSLDSRTQQIRHIHPLAAARVSAAMEFRDRPVRLLRRLSMRNPGRPVETRWHPRRDRRDVEPEPRRRPQAGSRRVR